MEKWEIALQKFIKEWRDKEEVLGAIITGSYAVGNQTNFSDIDVHIVLSDEVDWRERGNRIVDGFLIEYFANPIRKLKQYQEDDYKEGIKTDARMFTIGKVLFDKTGAVEEMKQFSLNQLNKELKKKDDTWIEMAKYSLWDQMDSLNDLTDANSSSFEFIYFTNLKNIIETYAKFSCVEITSSAKLYKVLSDEEFKNRYRINSFPDKDFVDLTIKCITIPENSNIKRLTDYVVNRMGGFNIDGWKLRTSAD